MYHSIFTFVLYVNRVPFTGQKNNEANTLLGNRPLISKKDIGFFVAPSYGFTQMDGSTASLFNLRGGLTLKDKFSFGAYFITSINQINPQSETLPNVCMDYWTAGGFAEYTLLSKKIFHITFPLYVGYGEVEMDREEGDTELGEANKQPLIVGLGGSPDTQQKKPQ